MTIEIIKGDLLDAFDRGDVDVIGHVVNCQGKMNSGIAKSIRERYPEVYSKYMDECNYVKEKRDMLGAVVGVQIPNLLGIDNIYNLYAQYNFGYDGNRYLNYGAMSKCLHYTSYEIADQRIDLTVGFPYQMGCGLAGGNWEIVMELIEYFFKNHTVKIYRL